MVVPSFTIGVLGQAVFDLGFVDAALIIIFFNLLSVLTVCFFSTFGAAFGLRQMVLSRFYFGWWGVKLSWFFPFPLIQEQPLITYILQLRYSTSWHASDGPQQILSLELS